MSINEQAQYLGALTEQVPSGGCQQIVSQLESLHSQVNGILGDTASAQEVNGQISAVINETQQLAAGLEQLRQLIADKAAYHQQG